MINIKPNPLMIPNFLGSNVTPPLNTFPSPLSSMNLIPPVAAPSSLLALLSSQDYAFTAPSFSLQNLLPLPDGKSNYKFLISKGNPPSTSGGGSGASSSGKKST
ncbi:MAG: hypothetical protein HEQ32_00750 [Vampirovibrio sp.]